MSLIEDATETLIPTTRQPTLGPENPLLHALKLDYMTGGHAGEDSDGAMNDAASEPQGSSDSDEMKIVHGPSDAIALYETRAELVDTPPLSEPTERIESSEGFDDNNLNISISSKDGYQSPTLASLKANVSGRKNSGRKGMPTILDRTGSTEISANTDSELGPLPEPIFPPQEGTKCYICSKEFPNFLDHFSHMYSHDPIWQFECKVCDKRFQFPDEYRMHNREHTEASQTGESDIVESVKLLGESDSTQNGTIEALSSETLPASGSSATKKQCETCGKWFLNVKSHQTRTASCNPEIRALTCQCGKQFNSIKGLKVHQSKYCRRSSAPIVLSKTKQIKRGNSVLVSESSTSKNSPHKRSRTISDSRPINKPRHSSAGETSVILYHRQVCHICQRDFDTPKGLKTHVRYCQEKADKKATEKLIQPARRLSGERSSVRIASRVSLSTSSDIMNTTEPTPEKSTNEKVSETIIAASTSQTVPQLTSTANERNSRSPLKVATVQQNLNQRQDMSDIIYLVCPFCAVAFADDARSSYRSHAVSCRQVVSHRRSQPKVRTVVDIGRVENFTLASM